MDRQQAKHILKNTGYIGNEVGVAFDVAIKSMDKLEKIEQIIGEWNDDWQASQKDLWMYLADIKEILEQE
jgi:hypothetical protein